ncbi:MAG: transcription repressor NadR [Clostridiales bacterium]|nr:transcription repressor NadR [Clostridiales bacterium]
MEGDARRKKILEILHEETLPISGTELAGRLGVSRQVIVQDIALLRATDKNILSTNKGYILFVEKLNRGRKRRTYKVKHADEAILDELNTIVDLGGKILDVVIEHDIYGQIAADLIINSRADAEAFVKQTVRYKTKPLNNLTYGVHFHTVEANSEEILERIADELDKKGYLIE